MILHDQSLVSALSDNVSPMPPARKAGSAADR
jgi:hypothetical protein